MGVTDPPPAGVAASPDANPGRPAGSGARHAAVLRWGVLGGASICERVVPTLQTPRSRLVAIASRTPERAAALAHTYGAERADAGYDAVVDAADIDAVYVPLPNALHAEWARRCLDAGKHVLCEKPLTTRLADTRSLFDAAAHGGRVLHEAFMYRHHPQWQVARSWIGEGRIGDIRTIEGAFSFALDDDASIVASAALGGGALLDVGCYPVDAALWVLDAGASAAQAVARGGTVDDTLAGVLEVGEVIVTVSTSIRSFERHVFEVVGSRGAIRFAAPWVASGDATVVLATEAGEERVLVPAGNPYAAQTDAFVAACLRGEASPDRTTGSLRTAAALDALRAAAASGARVEVEAV